MLLPIREDRTITRLIDQFLMRRVLTESSLSQLLGPTPEAQQLVKWLHRNNRLSNTAEYGLVDRSTDRIQWLMFKGDSDNFIIIQGPDSAMAIKPDEAVLNDIKAKLAASGREFTPNNPNIVYQLVGFTRDGARFDNQLIPYPNPKDFGLTADDLKRIDQNPKLLDSDIRYRKYAAEIKNIEQQHHRRIGPNAPVTQIDSARGGLPFRRDPHHRPHTLLDQIKDVMRGPFKIYTVMSHVGGLRGDASKEFALGHEPAKIPKGDIRGAFGEPSAGTRQLGGIERDKIAARSRRDQLTQLVFRLKPLLTTFISRANDTLVAQRKSTKDPAELRRYRDIINQIDDFEIALETSEQFDISDQQDSVVQVFARAINELSGIDDLSSPEGQQFLDELVDPTTMNTRTLKPVLQAVYRQLVNGQSI